MPRPPKPHFGTAGFEPATSDTWISDGYLFIVGRIKDVINRGGQKVAPAEVEEALLSIRTWSKPSLFPSPIRRLGEDVAAAVVLRPAPEGTAQQAPSLRPRTPGQVQGPWPYPDCARRSRKAPSGKIKRSELAAALSMTLRRARKRRSVGPATLGIGAASWPRTWARSPGARSDRQSTRMSSRSARIHSR